MVEKSSATGQEPLFKELKADIIQDDGPMELESLCMECHENGTTKLLLTRIPMFKEVVVSSFYCPHCGFSNSSIQSGAAIEPKGVKFTYNVQEMEHLNRLIVKAETATVSIPELEFEIPPSVNKGKITTVENILTQAAEGLEKEQRIREAMYPELAAKLKIFIQQLRDCLQLKRNFTYVLDDPAGNSFVENKFAPKLDPCLKLEYYTRTEQQDKLLGLSCETESETSTATEDAKAEPVSKDEVVAFPTNCYNCNSPTETRMKLVDIPHFKQVIVMATTCQSCGYKSNEVKSGSGVSETGTQITLRLTNVSDLSRDVVLAETAMLLIPSLEFESSHSTSSGRFTTIEGLLTEVRTQLQKSNPFFGDSVPDSELTKFLSKLSEIIDGKVLGVDIIIDDPAGNSYVQNPFVPDNDPHLTIHHYERNATQNDLLGLTDMKTEDYQ